MTGRKVDAIKGELFGTGNEEEGIRKKTASKLSFHLHYFQFRPCDYRPFVKKGFYSRE